MHPILLRPERLALYLGAWLLVGLLLVGAAAPQGLGWYAASAFVFPLVIVYAFVCLSAWYVCRATPLSGETVLRTLASSLFGALVASLLLSLVALGWIRVLASIPRFAPVVPSYRAHMPFLFASGVLLYLLAVAVHYVVLALEMAREADRRRLELQVMSRDAELRALRAQIDPHFLYNSLNSISALTSADPMGARRMCVLLGDFLRNTLRVGARERITLAEELALTDDFLEIEQVRFGSRLRVERRVDEAALTCRVPPLLLQPLVENAVTHGIAGLVEGGVIRLDIARQDGRLSIAIENPRDSDMPASKGRGLGLDNVKRRLHMMFGRDARLVTHAGPASFRAGVELPWSVDE